MVTLSGVDFYLGPHGMKVSHHGYDRVVTEWLANGRRSSVAPEDSGVTVAELIARYWRFAQGYYRKAGSVILTRDASFLKRR